MIQKIIIKKKPYEHIIKKIIYVPWLGQYMERTYTNTKNEYIYNKPIIYNDNLVPHTYEYFNDSETSSYIFTFMLLIIFVIISYYIFIK